MYKRKLFLLLAWVLVVNANAQNPQLKYWSLGSSNVILSDTTPSIKGTGLPSSFKVANSIYDAKGNILFYVGDWKIYNGFGDVIDYINLNNTTGGNLDIVPEYSIVPCIENESSCKKRYYIFYNLISDSIFKRARNNLYAKLITIDNNTATVTSKDITDANGKRRLIAESTPPVTGERALGWQCSGKAVSRKFKKIIGESNSYLRYLYFVAGSVQKITLTDVDGTQDGISTPATIFKISNNPNFSFNPLEADLSHDGTKLLWGSSTMNTYSHFYYLLGIDTNTGDWNTSLNSQFSIGTSSFNVNPLRGVEFTPDGKEILVTTGGNTSNDHGIYHKKLNPLNAPFVFIAGTKNYAASQLELAYNGLIYAGSRLDSNYAGVNVSTFSFPNSKINTIGNSNWGTIGGALLPDQIDGENYTIPLAFYPVKDVYFPSVSQSPHEATISESNPFLQLPMEGNKVKVAGSLNFIGSIWQDTTTWILDRLNFYMAKDAKITVGKNMILKIYNCTFQSADCAEMWKGIEVVDNGRVIIQYTGLSSTPPAFYDAVTAIKVNGNGAQISVSGTIFNRNKNHLDIANYKPYNPTGIDIKDCKFLHTQPLRIFNNGQQFPGSGVFGDVGIKLSGIYNQNEVSLFLTGNTFEGGTYGILSEGIPFRTSNRKEDVGTDFPNTFKNFSRANSICIKLDMLNRSSFPFPKVEIQDAQFTNVVQALYVTGRTDLDFNRNVVDKASKHAVEIFQNNNTTMNLTNNYFYNFQQSAILLNSNFGSSDTRITISDDTFKIIAPILKQNLHKPTAITIMEPANISQSQSYKMLRICKNTMDKVACGIMASGIIGRQLMDKDYIKNYDPNLNRTDINDFDSNTISVYATYSNPPAQSDYNMGIQLTKNTGLVAANNTITSNQYTQWRSAGIYSDNTQQTLVFKNTITAGRGIAAKELGLGNDIKCNVLAKGVNGISLEDYKMRQPGQTHGLLSDQSRNNAFSGTSQSNIELYLHRVAPSLYNIQNQVNTNQWFMNSTPTVSIQPAPTCAPFVNCIKRTGAPDKCGFTFTNGSGNSGNKLVFSIPENRQPGDELYNWQLQYEYERQQKELGLVHNRVLSNLIDAEQLIAEGNNAEALAVLNTMQPQHMYERNYIQVFTILATARLANNRPLDSMEIATYISIAEQNAYAMGPAIHTARAILWQQEGLKYMDMVDRNPGGIEIQVLGNACQGNQIPTNLVVQLKNNLGYTYSTDEVPIVMDEAGYATIAASVVKGLAPEMTYTFVFNNGQYPSPPLQTITQWMDNIGNDVPLCGYGKKGDNQPVTESDTKASAVAALFNSLVSIYPNPATDNITITLPATGEYAIVIYDMMGKKIYNGLHTQKVTIPTNIYRTGVYLVNILDTHGNMVYAQKVVIQQ